MTMRYPQMIRRILAELSGEAAYARYCAHLGTHHPKEEVPTAREFFLTRMEQEYTRPSHCC
jgi:uncharacterized short protein YbdD (DUF466 family)